MAETLDAALTTDLTIDSASWWKRLDATNDKANTNEDTPVTIDVLHNDVGALGIIKVNGESVTADTPPITLTSGATVDLDGKTLLYDPGEAFQGLNSGESKIDTFSYTVVGKGKATDTATVDVNITGVTDDDPSTNQPPVAADDKAYLPNYYPYPLPYEEAATTADASLSDDLIYTTLAIGEEGDPYPYPNDVTINVLANDTDPDGDKLTVSKINGTDVADGGSVKLDSGATVTLKDGSLFYNGADYVGIDPVPLAEQDAITANSEGSSELVSIPYPGEVKVDSFTYSASDGTLQDDATVDIYRMSDWYILGSDSAV